jgi:predicted amidophosphoribosyltransferase
VTPCRECGSVEYSRRLTFCGTTALELECTRCGAPFERIDPRTRCARCGHPFADHCIEDESPRCTVATATDDAGDAWLCGCPVFKRPTTAAAAP